ncbi:MAG: glutamate--tRNA ligase [Rubrivivax sp.]|nr:glutamate--tRNA ligase [Rubrivivax sp.]
MSTSEVRTRIAPSPTGYLHLGTARTALYSWAYARHHGGTFVLRIEDTDVARSTQDSVEQILTSLQWLGLQHDEGPIYQMQRLARYHAVVEQMIAAGTAYRCYATPEELNAMRDAQRARGEKTLYDRRWRPALGKTLPPPPVGVNPVVRFANPVDGVVTWRDFVKGPISIRNEEIDDLIILRQDAVPTYNFAVVVDDWDMAITHVFRGDEHINNTPWQINLFNALGAPLPLFGHCPVILGDDGHKLSKRRGAVSVTAYRDNGYLPEALLNYLARLGWSHGDEELFTPAQMVQWFDGSHLAKSPAQWDPAKLAWVNAHHIKHAADDRLALLVQEQLSRRGVAAANVAVLARAAALFKDRCSTTVELADWAAMLFVPVAAIEADRSQFLTDAVRPALQFLRERLGHIEWTPAAIAAALKETLAAHAPLKMGQLAPALRVLVCGRAQTPSIDAVLALFERSAVLSRLQAF